MSLFNFSAITAGAEDNEGHEKNKKEQTDEIIDSTEDGAIDEPDGDDEALQDDQLPEELLETPSKYENGDYGNHINELKQGLTDLGFGDYPEAPNEYYGDYTKKIVIDFQTYYDLESNGIAGESTLELMDELLTSPLQLEGEGNEVVDVKEALVESGYLDSDELSAIFDEKAEQAVLDLQEEHELIVNGIVDSVTKQKLEELTVKNETEEQEPGEEEPEQKESLPPREENDNTTEEESQSDEGNNEKDVLQDEPVKEDEFKDKQEEAASEQEDSNVMKKGTTSEEVVDLKLALEKLGFQVSNNLTAYFGTKTAETVKNFQSYYGVTEDEPGTAGTATLAKMEEITSTSFQLGGYDEETITLKEKLDELGYRISNNPTTYFGSSTAQTIKKFQDDHGLVVNGIADPLTWDKINSLLSASKNKSLSSFSIQAATTETYSKGDYHEGVIQLKADLEQLGFHVSNNPTTYYGSTTEKVVKEFQSYYGLVADGIAGRMTFGKIDAILSSPFQVGGYSSQNITLKENLSKVGFHTSNNPTTYYGGKTADSVSSFQRKYGLVINGIAGPVTRDKISQLVRDSGNNDSTTLSKGNYHDDVIDLKVKLEKLGFHISNNPTTYYGGSTESTVKEFQSYYRVTGDAAGVAGKNTWNKINDILSTYFQVGKRNKDNIRLKEDLNSLGFNGIKVTDFYGSYTKKRVEDFQRHYKLQVNGIADGPTLEKVNQLKSSPLRKGQYHNDAIQLKKDLAAIGYSVSSNPTSYFGDKTVAEVKSFQRAYDLPASGIADTYTLNKLAQVVKNNVIKIFLDPGHGGHDAGASSYGLKEKDVVLEIALATANHLQNNYQGVDVNLSRTTDKFIQLEERARLANNWNADYFVSFHTNAFNGKTGGFETFIHNGNVSNETVKRQSEIHSYLINRLNVNERGKKSADFSVLRNTKMSAILLEYMFIDNKFENDFLQKSYNRQWLGQITAEAIAQSYNLKKR